MSLRDEEQKVIKQRIEDFHWYLDNDVPVEKAKEIILKSTSFVPVIDYVKNYK